MKRRRKPALQYVGGFTPVADEHHCIRNGDYVAWVVLMELYARARRKPGYANAARGRVHLDRGQCLFGLRELAARVGASVSAVRWKLHKLCALGAVTIDPSPTGSIATIPFLAGSPATTSNVSETERAPSSTLAARSTAHSGPATCAPIDDPAHPTRSNSTLAARSTHLTDTGVEGDTGVGAARHNSSKREGLGEEGIDPRVVELHEYQEKHRRRALREAYRPIHVSAVSRQIAERLVDHSIDDCKAVIRADASEVIGGGKAFYFGVNTWSAKNFGIKLPQQLQAEQTRRARAKEERAERDQSPELRFYVEQRRLGGYVRVSDGATERDVLLAKYDQFTRRFHKHKGTWPEVKRFRDREDHTWFRRDEVSDG